MTKLSEVCTVMASVKKEHATILSCQEFVWLEVDRLAFTQRSDY